MTDESAPIEPTSLEQALKEYPDKVQVLETPTDPPPDMSTKPKDIVEYCFGYACPKKHVFDLFDSITPAGYDTQKACPKCGELAKPSVIRKIAEPVWRKLISDMSSEINDESEFKWRTTSLVGYRKITLWSRYEFVHYLDPVKPRPRRRKK
jgi:hypothetical protein